MRIATDCFLVLAVLTAWFGAIAFLRLTTALERLHAVSLINLATIGAITLAGLSFDGATPQTAKCAFIFAANAVIGALLSHAVARAIHLRGGERR